MDLCVHCKHQEALPGNLLALTRYSAGSLCSPLRSKPAFQTWPGAHAPTAQVAASGHHSPLSQKRSFGPPRQGKEEQNAMHRLPFQKRTWFYLRIKTLEENSTKKEQPRKLRQWHEGRVKGRLHAAWAQTLWHPKKALWGLKKHFPSYTGGSWCCGQLRCQEMK